MSVSESNPLVVSCAVASVKGSHHAGSITACSLRASFFERAGGELVASLRATHFVVVVVVASLLVKKGALASAAVWTTGLDDKRRDDSDEHVTAT